MLMNSKHKEKVNPTRLGGIDSVHYILGYNFHIRKVTQKTPLHILFSTYFQKLLTDLCEFCTDTPNHMASSMKPKSILNRVMWLCKFYFQLNFSPILIIQ